MKTINTAIATITLIIGTFGAEAEVSILTGPKLDEVVRRSFLLGTWGPAGYR